MPKNKTPNNLSNDTELLYMISVALTQRFKKIIISHSLIYYLFKGGSAVRISPRNHSVIFCSTQTVARQTGPICKGKRVPSAKNTTKQTKRSWVYCSSLRKAVYENHITRIVFLRMPVKTFMATLQ